MSEVKQTQWPVLRAMAKNYAGGHRWDHLDGKAVNKAADEIIALAADNKRLREALEKYADDNNWCYDTCDIGRDIAKAALAGSKETE